MKKIFAFISLAAVAAVIAVSCNTKDKKDSSADTLPTPSLEKYSFKVNFNEPRPEIPLPNVKPDGNHFNGNAELSGDAHTGKLVGLEAMNDGTWNADIKAKDSEENESDFNFSGKFDVQGKKVSVGDILTLAQFGTLEIKSLNGSSISFSFTPLGGGSPITLDGMLVSELNADSSLLADIARGWKVEKTFVTVKSDALPAGGIGGEYSGCDIPKIAKDLKEKGLKIDDRKVSYKVTGISLSKFGTIRIYLSNDDVIEGSIKSGISGGLFDYSFDVFDNDNPVLSANGNGTVKIVKSKLNLELSGTLHDNEKKDYEAIVKFILVYE
ncbi:MAG: hypothetical protein IKR69_05090 [Bacteroidales bacterium]|nr:hypothetical protein [Bacteroidales bacterium]